LEKIVAAIRRAAFASTLAIRNAARFVRTIEARALDRNSPRMANATKGRVCAFKAGKSKPANEITRDGSLPLVRKKVTEVARNPMANTAVRSTKAKAARSPVSRNQRLLSLGSMNPRLDLIAPSTPFSIGLDLQ
jgi:hypothetical protein